MWVNARSNEKAPGRTAKGSCLVALHGFEPRPDCARKPDNPGLKFWRLVALNYLNNFRPVDIPHQGISHLRSASCEAVIAGSTAGG